MPHLTIEYSSNVGEWADIDGLCDRLRRAAIESGLFSSAGVRVRAICCRHYSIADGAEDRGFVDISVRLRGGRPHDARRRATQMIFGAAEDYLGEALESHPLALSLEMRDIDPSLSPKVSSLKKHVDP
ncbi:MAG: 5-carboxymethyl-2-hydroxymuconate isomerase [Rhodobacteraceae bacterium]|nr:5-carboxymethyl-2-hydroxymuconate isomerase [Paracoccaceae bacterium]